jgi:hypothetical protein
MAGSRGLRFGMPFGFSRRAGEDQGVAAALTDRPRRSSPKHVDPGDVNDSLKGRSRPLTRARPRPTGSPIMKRANGVGVHPPALATRSIGTNGGPRGSGYSTRDDRGSLPANVEPQTGKDHRGTAAGTRCLCRKAGVDDSGAYAGLTITGDSDLQRAFCRRGTTPSTSTNSR